MIPFVLFCFEWKVDKRKEEAEQAGYVMLDGLKLLLKSLIS